MIQEVCISELCIRKEFHSASDNFSVVEKIYKFNETYVRDNITDSVLLQNGAFTLAGIGVVCVKLFETTILNTRRWGATTGRREERKKKKLPTILQYDFFILFLYFSIMFFFFFFFYC